METLSLVRNLGPFSNVHSGFQNIAMRTFMFGVVGSLAMFISSWEKTDRMRDQLFDTHRDYGDTFDFIIVGGGTSGALVAKRLSEHYRVLLLEAGGDPHPFQSIPMFSSYMLNYKELDWMHTTVPQKRACLSCDNRRMGISQGKSLGGTSNLNFMHHSRGSPIDYDNWAEMIGDPSWSYHNLLPYFKKHEEYAAQGPWNRKDHGFTGEIRMETPSYTGMGREFIASAKELGYKRVDLNGKFTEGFDAATYAMKRGHRQASYSSFIRSIRPRWNLVIYKYAHVNRILMKERNGTQSAYGVEYDRHGKRKFVFAKKEIILSAGAIQSAKLLLLSGIGPKEDLESLSIPVKADLPVGKNLQDHVHTFLGPFMLKSPKSLLIDRDITSDAFIRYSSIKSRGPLTTTGIQASGLIASSRAKRNSGENEIWPDIQLSLYGIAAHESYSKDMSHAFRLKEEMISKYMKSATGKDSFSIIVSMGRPESRGVVMLQSKDPYTVPIIDPNYFDKDSDMDVMINGIQKALSLVENTTIFRNYGAQFTTEMLPGCEPYLFRSDAYWECFASHFSVSMGHVAGTVPMGGALDSQLRVLGVNRLRVVDSSVMPTIVGSGTQAATLVIGEKASDLIIKYWGLTDNKVTGNLHHEDFTSRPAFHNSLLNESQVVIKSLRGLQLPVQIDPNYIYNSVPTSEKPSTIKSGRSAVIDNGNFTQSNSLSTGDQSVTPQYDYSMYFPTERRPVVHIKDRNIPEVPSTSAKPVKTYRNDPALRAMENYFSEVTSTTIDPEEGNKATEKGTVYPNINPTALFDHLTSTSTSTPKYTTPNFPEKSNEEIEQPRYINYPIEIISYSKNENGGYLEKGTRVVHNQRTTTPQIDTVSNPPVRFSKITTRKPVNNYKYATNQILRETMPLLTQRNKENPILQYQYQGYEQLPPVRYPVSPSAYGMNVHSLRNNVAKFLSPDQTQKVASQNSFIFSNKPVNFNAENIKQNTEGLRSSVFKILHPNATYETSTTPKPNAFRNIFAPFSKIFETPLRFVKDPVKFVSEPLKFVTGHIKLVTDPLSKAVPERFSKVIQAPINFMERIHAILNANKKPANNNVQNPHYETFGSVLTTAVEASTTNPNYGFSFKVTDAALKNNYRDHLTSSTTEKPVETVYYQVSASSTTESNNNLNTPFASATTASSSFRKLPQFKYFSPPTKATTALPSVNKGYRDHYTSFNTTFDYNQSTSGENFSQPQKDYELGESEYSTIAKLPEIPPYEINHSAEKPNFFDFQKEFMNLNGQRLPNSFEPTTGSPQQQNAEYEEKKPIRYFPTLESQGNRPVYHVPSFPNKQESIEQVIHNIQGSPQAEKSVSEFPGSKILKVNSNDNNDHLPEDVKKLLKSQDLEKDTQVYVLLSDQENLGDNFENIPNLKEILHQFPEGTEVKSLLNPNIQGAFQKQNPSSSIQKPISATTEKNERKGFKIPNLDSYQYQTIFSANRKESTAVDQQNIPEAPWVEPTSSSSSTDNPASFKIKILKPKPKQ